MTRASLTRRIAAGLLALAWQDGLRTTVPAAPARGISALTPEERATLLEYAGTSGRLTYQRPTNLAPRSMLFRLSESLLTLD